MDDVNQDLNPFCCWFQPGAIRGGASVAGRSLFGVTSSVKVLGGWMDGWMLSGFGGVVNTDVSSSELAGIRRFSWVENARSEGLETCKCF